MQRRNFLRTAGAGLLLAQAACAQGMSRLGDGALALNGAIQPRERDEKRVYPAATRDAAWATSVHRSRSPGSSQRFTTHEAFVEGLATADGVPVVLEPLVRPDIAQSSKPGFYLYFGVTIGTLQLPETRPPEFISSTSRHFFTSNSNQLKSRKYPPGYLSFDYRQIRLIEGDTVHRPTGELWHGGGRPVFDQPVSAPVEYPGVEVTNRTLPIHAIMRFDLPRRPLRFTLELPPLLVQGVEVPMPTCFFEPYDTLRDQWV